MDGDLDDSRSVKIIMIGPAGAGKTSLVRVLGGDKFQGGYKTTIGSDYTMRHVKIPTPSSETQSTDQYTTVKVELWDTAGQERFKTLTTSYYRNINCCVLVFPLYDSKNFKSVELSNILDRLEDAVNYSTSPHPLFIIGNKSDLATKNGVQNPNYEEYQGLSTEFFREKVMEKHPANYPFAEDGQDELDDQQKNSAPKFQSIHYREMSAKDGTGEEFNNLLQELVTLAYDDYNRGLKDNGLENTIRINNTNFNQQNQAGCC